MTSERKTILDIRDLQISLPAGGDRPHALWDFNLTVGEGEIVCLVGESGSGKSLAASAAMRLLPEPHVHVSKGSRISCLCRRERCARFAATGSR
jgi:peptide/nickel transport system ATP-binding protein